MKLFVILGTVLLLAVASQAAIAENRFESMRLAADELVDSLENETTVENKKEVSNLEKILGDLIERIRIRIEEKHQSAQDLLVKAKEIASRLRDLHAAKSEKLQGLLERLNGRVRELVQSLIDRITGRPRGFRNSIDDTEQLLKELELDQLLLKTFVMSAVQQPEGRFRRDTNEGEENKKKSTLESIKDMFKGLGVHLFGRYQEFMDWLSTVWMKGIEAAKGHHARIVAIAKEVIADAKDMHKETLREALEILRPFRKELGSMWGELVDAVNKALKQQ